MPPWQWPIWRQPCPHRGVFTGGPITSLAQRLAMHSHSWSGIVILWVCCLISGKQVIDWLRTRWRVMLDRLWIRIDVSLRHRDRSRWRMGTFQRHRICSVHVLRHHPRNSGIHNFQGNGKTPKCLCCVSFSSILNQRQLTKFSEPILFSLQLRLSRCRSVEPASATTESSYLLPAPI